LINGGNIGSSPPKTIPDTDNDGFSDDDERNAGTDPNDPKSHPTAFNADMDLDLQTDDRVWLEDPNHDGIADYVAIDINSNVQVDARIQIIQKSQYKTGDFDGDGKENDCSYTITYAFANGRQVQPRITATIFDYGCNISIDKIKVEKVS
jgi:hypothetical protein